MTGYSHSPEYLGQDLGLGPLVRQAFARYSLCFSQGKKKRILYD